MKRNLFHSIIALVLTLTMVLSLIPAGAWAQETENAPNNAHALVARGEEAFVKSDDPFSANWIWSPSDDGAGNRWMAFRKDVTLDASDLSGQITAKISADTKYWLWINGKMAVFEGQLKRGAALLNKAIYLEGTSGQPDLAEMIQEVATYYDEVDLTPYLKEGSNTIVALVWYLGNEGHSHVGSGKGAFLFESQMGEKQVLSDASWKVSRHKGYQASGGIGGYAQEYHVVYDAQAGYNDFYKPEFDVSGWEDAAVIGAAGDKPWNELWPRTIPEWKVWDLVTYAPDDTEHVTKSGTTYRMDLPTNIQFTPYLKVKAPAGKQIVISCPNAGNTSVTYTTMGGENGEAVVQEYESPAWINWWFVNFNVPDDVEILEMGYRQSGYNTELTGYFTSNDDFFNTLWTKARDTVYVNIRDTFMDCPDRERCPWLGDMVNEAQIAYYTMDESIFDAMRKDIAVRVNWQNSDGVIPTTAPNTFRHNEYSELTGQSLAGVMSWFTYYLYSGDRVTLEQAYPALLRYLEMFDLEEAQFTVPFARRNGTNTVHQSWIDWGSNIDKDLCLNIWAYIGVKTVIDFATTLGDSETAARYEKIRDLMKAKFDQTFWNGSEYRSSTYTGPADDRGQALAVYAGLASPDKYPVLRDILLKNQFASPYMVKYSIEALYLMGYPEAAEQRMKESYARDVPLSDPTFSEGWGGGGTKNHGWSGGGLIALSGYAAGVRPIEAGYDKFLVKPQMGSQITSIDAGIPSAKGLISVKASKSDGQFALSVHVPEGSSAVIGIPRMDGGTAVACGDSLIWNDGETAFDIPGLSYADNDYSHIYFNAQPGDWSFTASAAEKTAAQTYCLTIPALENGSVTVNGEQASLPYQADFAAGEAVTVKAIPNEGYQFESFDGTVGSREESVILSMDSDKTVRANFVKVWKFDGSNLTVTANKPGKVLMNGKQLTLPYSNALEKEVQITLTAQDDEDYVFAAWRDGNGKVVSTEPSLSFDMSEDRTYEVEFAAKAGDNFALGKEVTVSSTVNNGMFGPQKATDGIYTVTGSNEGWTSLETSDTQWIMVDLGQSYAVETVKLFPRNNGVDNGYGIPIDLEILTSQDGETWTEVYSVKDQERPLSDFVSYRFDVTDARYLKVNGSKLRQNPADGNRTRFQLSEIEVYGEVFDYAPQVSLQPQSFQGAVGSSVTFSVAARGQAPMNYQWQVSSDGESWTDIGGANRPNYTVSAKYTLSGNRYRCVIDNPLGQAISDEATLTVVSKNYALNRPSTVSSNQEVGTLFLQKYLNDGISATLVNGKEGYTSTANTTDGIEWVVIDIGAPKSINQVVIYPRYNGKDDGYGIPEDYNVQVSLDGETWTTVYEASGTERPTSGPVVLNFDSVMAGFVKFEGTKLRVNPADANQKRLQIVEMEVYNVGAPAAPVLEEEPEDVTAEIGVQAAFSVLATGGDELAYQWQRSADGVTFADIASAADATLRFDTAKADHGAYYRCVLTDEFGRTATRAARLYLIGDRSLSDNYALGRPVTASSTMGESKYSREKLVDGVTTHTEGVNHGWMGDNTQYNKDHVEWVTIDMQEMRTINTIRIYPIMGDVNLRGYGMPLNMNIYVSDDGGEWTLIQQYRDIPVPELYTDFAVPETTARFVKVEGTNLRQNPNNGNSYRMAMAELEIYQMSTKLLPVIDLHPADTTVQAGDIASFAVSVEEECTFQWQKLVEDEWTDLEGKTEAVLAFPAELRDSKTSYRCVVTGDGGSMESQAAELTVTARGVAVEASLGGSPVQSVPVNEIFHVQVKTDGGVKNVRLYNEYGTAMGRREYTAAGGEDGRTFDFEMSIGTVGKGRQLSVFVQTEDGGAYVDSGVKLVLDVQAAAPQIISVRAPQTMVANRAEEVVVLTDHIVQKVSIYNEYGLKILTARAYRDTDAGREFVVPLKVGTAGVRSFAAVGSNRYGIESEAVMFGPISVKYF